MGIFKTKITHMHMSCVYLTNMNLIIVQWNTPTTIQKIEKLYYW